MSTRSPILDDTAPVAPYVAGSNPYLLRTESSAAGRAMLIIGTPAGDSYLKVLSDGTAALILKTSVLADIGGIGPTGPTITGATLNALVRLGIKSSLVAHDLRITNTENLSADRTLNISLLDFNRLLTIGGDVYFSGAFTTLGAFSTILRATANTDVTLPASGTLATVSQLPTVSDAAYDATTWNGNTDAPSKNAVRDKIETLQPAGDYQPYNSNLDTLSEEEAPGDAGLALLQLQSPLLADSYIKVTHASGAPVYRTPEEVFDDVWELSNPSSESCMTIGPSGTHGYLKIGQLRGYTVATLPASPTLGDTAYVTDADGPSYLAQVVGGSTTRCPVFYNGTHWVCH